MKKEAKKVQRQKSFFLHKYHMLLFSAMLVDKFLSRLKNRYPYLDKTEKSLYWAWRSREAASVVLGLTVITVRLLLVTTGDPRQES